MEQNQEIHLNQNSNSIDSKEPPKTDADIKQTSNIIVLLWFIIFAPVGYYLSWKDKRLNIWIPNFLILLGVINILHISALTFLVLPKLTQLYYDSSADINYNNLSSISIIVLIISVIEILTGGFLKKQVKKVGYLKNSLAGICFGFLILQYVFLGSQILGFSSKVTVPTNTPPNTPAISSDNNQIPSLQQHLDTYSWKTFENNDISFLYPPNWIRKPVLMRGSGFTQEFEDPDGNFTFAYIVNGNYNQLTAKPYANFDDFLNTKHTENTIKPISVDGHVGARISSGNNNENINMAEFFSLDSEQIYTFDVSATNTNPNTFEANTIESAKLLDMILSTIDFKTKNPGPNELGVLKTASVLVQDASYYGPPHDTELYQLEVGQSEHLFAKSDAVDLEQYIGKRVNILYREVKGMVMGEQQLVIVASVVSDYEEVEPSQ